MTFARLPYGYFLENRNRFLETIERQVKECLLSRHEHRLISLIQKQGNDNNNNSSNKSDTLSFGKQAIPKKGYSIANSSTLRTLMQAGCHYGHAAARLHQRMHPYVLGVSNATQPGKGIHIIDLDKTVPLFRQACLAVQDMAMRGAKIVWVGSKPMVQRLVYECAMSSAQYFVNRRWLGGTITNREHVLGVADLSPDLLIILDYPSAKVAIKEANKSMIPIVAIVDTDCDPRPITYPIPSNDDSLASVELIGRTLAQAAWLGKQEYGEKGPLSLHAPHADIVASAERFIKLCKPHIDPALVSVPEK